ncbi:MAG TPA: FlgD immunoglobulin-like domain containing protein [Candidatus Kapabacteria bacterium]|nr:FlgD immunoglobulin-like domain containing protein [Candidatus Kapabacteria bacterium]
MHRLLKAVLLVMTFVLLGSDALAQTFPIVQVSGRLPQGNYRVFARDTLYQVTGYYVISGTLLIEPGTTVEFLPNSRMIDSVGGRIIADGDVDAIWNNNTSGVSAYPNGYCDLNYMRANVITSGKPEITAPAPNHIGYVPLLLFYHANKRNLCATDPNLRNTQYRRNVVRAPITFRGRPVNQFSPEWGHIVVLPGADTAFFRNCNFVNFRKDITVVQSTQFYAPSTLTGYNSPQITAGFNLNTQMQNLTTGGGGAMTVFSSKTWILDCRFDSNFARYHGGAVQFLQAPFDASGLFYVQHPSAPSPANANFYPAVNPETYDLYGGAITTPFGSINAFTVTSPSAPAGSQFRQAYDDGRMAINRGRVRRVIFRDNRVMVSDTTNDVSGYRDNVSPEIIYNTNNPLVSGINVTSPAGRNYSPLRKNEAYGGAMYVSGRRRITVFLGRGSALVNSGLLPNGDPTDTMIFERNHAVNFQDTATLHILDTRTNPNTVVARVRSEGARGGAVYVGDSTSLHFELSRFQANFTATPNVDEANYIDRGRMSQGGGVYMSAASPEFTALGNVLFRNNKSGQGGALYLQARPDVSLDPLLSPIIGDSVWFIRNIAEYDGGAVYTQRNIRMQAPFLFSVDPTAPGNPTIDRRILLDSNSAGLAGGAIVIDNRTNPSLSRAAVENVLISYNTAGDTARVADTRLIKIYDPVAAPMAAGAEFGTATVRDDYYMPAAIIPEILGGGGVYSLSGQTNFYRSVEFLRNYTIWGNGGAIALILPGQRDNRYFLAAGDSAFDFVNAVGVPFEEGPMPYDQRQMTRFLGNAAWQNGITTGTHNTAPHGGTLNDPLRNGVGLGGAIYINDRQTGNPNPGVARTDSVILHRVRIEKDTAWSGSAVYSDNYDLRVVFNKSLVANNLAVSTEGAKVDTIQNYLLSPAASRTAGATFYGEIEGPMPSTAYHTDANAIYDNRARFIIRLPDAPSVPGGVGLSGIDSLRGNFWGDVQAPVTTILPSGTLQNTFYIQGDSCTLPLRNPAIVNQQGPFESPNLYSYTPVPVGLIPDTLLMQGRVYDIFDKGRDIKAVDYSKPRMAPIEDFAVGIPPRLNRFGTGVYANQVVRRLTRDPFIADVDSIYRTLQREFVGGHPIGYPLFLESRANYTGDINRNNDDRWALNYTVFFVINVETGEMIRANLKQFQEGGNVFRGRTEFVADSINRDPVARRTFEGRAAFSIGEIYRLSPRFYLDTPGEIPGSITDPEERIEYARMRAAEYEDSVALEGRRYGGRMSPLEVGGAGFRYINRVNPVSFADYYAGERYRALPVLTGDRIWVVSRTALWDTVGTITSVVDNARFTGLEFSIADLNSVPAPVVYGQRDSLENKNPVELRNSRFLVEDKVYRSDTNGRTISEIFEVTATDVNGFFDPRSLYFPYRYTGLRYEYNFLQEFFNGTTVPSNDPTQVRLASWLKSEIVYPGSNRSTRDSAHSRGFLRFFGTPHNPDVVPGGELLEIRVSNYPPGIQTIDSLRGLLPDTIVSRYIFLYPPYFNCQVYDARNARYLQQDTVDVGGATTTTYRMRIFVQDTPPVFLADSTPCPTNRPGFVVANLTNRLRFNFDLNTDDEQEDNNAQNEGWRFPYGRTTYGFQFIARYPETGDTSSDDVREVRPTWMADTYLHDATLVTDRGATFLRQGNIVIRIDSLEAINLLRNPTQQNNAFNLDSVFTVVVHDGHMGQNKRDMRVMVNVAPQLQPVAGPLVLPTAKEDFDYNPNLSDTTRRVQATDLNFNQRLRYELIYRDDALNAAKYQTGGTELDSNGTPVSHTNTIAYVRRDNCYFEAGLFEAPKTTPSWLKVNPVSGMLYGTPGLNDAPRTNATGGPETVTVVVTDENGLTDVRTYILEVDSTQHRPRLFGRPAIVCVDPTEAYEDSICVTDRDLPRIRFTERLTLEVISPAGFTIAPSTIDGGAGQNDTMCNLRISAPANTIRDTGKVRIVIRVTDIAGNIDSLVYQIAVSEPTDWTVPVFVSNTIIETNRQNATQRLVFGMARNATTGEESGARGNLDSNYCEYELPPQPPRDVFDARWTVPTTNGILRNIFPQAPQAGQGPLAWKAVFQPGFLQGGSFNYPVFICWDINDAATATSNIHIMDQVGGAVFRVDMKAPTGRGVRITPGSGVNLTVTGTIACLEIIQTAGIQGFVITYGLPTGVEMPTTGAASYMLLSNLPNPFSENTEIGFIAPKAGDVKLQIFNIQGDLVKTLIDGNVDAGTNKVLWNGTDEKGDVVASGTYTYRLTAGTTVLTRTMVRVR